LKAPIWCYVLDRNHRWVIKKAPWFWAWKGPPYVRPQNYAKYKEFVVGTPSNSTGYNFLFFGLQKMTPPWCLKGETPKAKVIKGHCMHLFGSHSNLLLKAPIWCYASFWKPF
jgi:hypothetical protein